VQFLFISVKFALSKPNYWEGLALFVLPKGWFVSRGKTKCAKCVG